MIIPAFDGFHKDDLVQSTHPVVEKVNNGLVTLQAMKHGHGHMDTETTRRTWRDENYNNLGYNMARTKIYENMFFLCM